MSPGQAVRFGAMSLMPDHLAGYPEVAIQRGQQLAQAGERRGGRLFGRHVLAGVKVAGHAHPDGVQVVIFRRGGCPAVPAFGGQ